MRGPSSGPPLSVKARISYLGEKLGVVSSEKERRMMRN